MKESGRLVKGDRPSQSAAPGEGAPVVVALGHGTLWLAMIPAFAA